MEEKEQLLKSNKQKSSSSFKTTSCIIATAAFEKAATFGLNVNMILYLENEYHMDLVTGTNIITLWTAACNFLPVLGAFLADSTVGRYPMIALGSIFGLLGTFLLWLTTIIPQARPPLCTTECNSSTTLQIIFLCFSLGLTSLGAGGIRSASMAFGADQFVKRYNKEELLAALDSYFAWFLNKACFVGDPERYFTANMDIQNSGNLCTVDQVEELKAVLKVIPLFLTGVLMSVTLSYGSIIIVQTMSMDRQITSNFEMPAASIGISCFISGTLCVVFYDRIIVPQASRIMGKPVCLTSKLKMGIGILFSILTMVVFAFIEYIRRGIAKKQGILDNPEAIVNMSAFWLILPFCLSGIGESMNSVGQYEFFYSEFPKSMSSIASTLRDLSMSAGGLVATLLLNIVDQVTSRGGKPSWISSNINQGHYDYFYLVVAGMCVVNMLYWACLAFIISRSLCLIRP